MWVGDRRKWRAAGVSGQLPLSVAAPPPPQPPQRPCTNAHLRPLAHGQLRDLQRRVVQLIDDAADLVRLAAGLGGHLRQSVVEGWGGVGRHRVPALACVCLARPKCCRTSEPPPRQPELPHTSTPRTSSMVPLKPRYQGFMVSGCSPPSMRYRLATCEKHRGRGVGGQQRINGDVQQRGDTKGPEWSLVTLQRPCPQPFSLPTVARSPTLPCQPLSLPATDQVARVVVGDGGGPARANAIRAIDQHRGQQGHVPAQGRVIRAEDAAWQKVRETGQRLAICAAPIPPEGSITPTSRSPSRPRRQEGAWRRRTTRARCSAPPRSGR